MGPKEVFGLIVRTVGLLAIIYGLWCGTFGIVEVLSPSDGTYRPTDYFVGGAFWVVIGIVLMLVAPKLVAISYR